MSLKKGSRIEDRFEVVDEIGKGGMATVYLVRDLRLQKFWAIKEVKVVTTPEGKKKTESIMVETNLLKSLDHSNIPSIVDIYRTDSSILILMDYVDGVSLRDYISNTEVIKERYIIKWAIDLCKVLQYLHNRQPKIIYRDMKPQNIMVKNDGEIRLLDFGIAREIKDGYNPENTKIAGTRGYIAPEMTANQWFDERSDIFALGRTLYFLATKHNPVKGGGDIRPIREWDATRSVGLEKIIAKATEQKPEDRYQTVDEMLYDLLHIDELSVEYKRKINGRLITLGSLFLGAMLTLGLGIYTRVSESQAGDRLYQSYLDSGNTTGDIGSYVKAIDLRPSELTPMYKLIDIYREDSVFTEAEEVQFLSIANRHLTTMRNNREYGELAFEIGKLYWYYYPSGGQVKSITWFEDAIANGSKDGKLARVYAEMGSFQKNILASIADVSDSGMYSRYWTSIKDMLSLEIGNDIVTLTLADSVYGVIDAYIFQLKSDGVSRQDIESVFNKVTESVNRIKSDNSRIVEMQTKLQGMTESLRELIKRAFE